jgi:hypothetical protein
VSPYRIRRPRSLFTKPVRQSSYLPGKPFSRAPGGSPNGRMLNFRPWTGEAPQLLIRVAAEVSAAPFLDLTMTERHAEPGAHFLQIPEN